MIRLICAGLVLLLAAFGGYATSAALRQPAVGVCYATDGQEVETTFLTGGATFYPIVSEATIEQLPDGFVVTHQVRFENRAARVYLPVVGR